MDCVEGGEVKGTLIGRGVYQKGEIKGSKIMQDAYEMGKNA
ncbi:MAG: hypothetical protein ACI32C_04965 [Candidatus Enteromonas sp.]